MISLVTGCLNDPVQDDLITYINDDIPTVFELELKAVGTYDSVTGPNYTDDIVLYEALVNEIIPTYNEFVRELEAISIDTDEVREIHEGYIKGANLQYNAFVRMVTALEQQDRQLIEEANSMLDEARKLMRDYQVNIKNLAEEHNVELTENLDSETL